MRRSDTARRFQLLVPWLAVGAIELTSGSVAGAPRSPDLVVRLEAPATAAAGAGIGDRITLTVTNQGTSAAWGTTRHTPGYMIDLTLGADQVVSIGLKAYSPHYAEDVLLQGGRVSRTDDLAPASTRRYAVGAVIPIDTPPGVHFLCAYVDPANAIGESSERNNASCVAVRVLPRVPEPTPQAPTPAPRATPANGVLASVDVGVCPHSLRRPAIRVRAEVAVTPVVIVPRANVVGTHSVRDRGAVRCRVLAATSGLQAAASTLDRSTPGCGR